MQGTIVKGIGGFYYVDTGERIYECKARGLFRKDGIIPCVGDVVEIDPLNEQEGYILHILPRKNVFIRPPLANVDCLVLVVAVTKPKPNQAVLDKFLVMGELHCTEIVICLNKVDQGGEKEAARLQEIYGSLYPIVRVSAATGEGVEALRELLRGKCSALAGSSGVGKSTLLNRLQMEAVAETGAISEKSSRGKHTTRHVELFSLRGGGKIFDTPGFTSFDILEADESTLAGCYPEIEAYGEHCRYDDCRHLAEPGCGVREALEAGKIHPQRYEAYIRHLQEIRSRKKYG